MARLDTRQLIIEQIQTRTAELKSAIQQLTDIDKQTLQLMPPVVQEAEQGERLDWIIEYCEVADRELDQLLYGIRNNA